MYQNCKVTTGNGKEDAMRQSDKKKIREAKSHVQTALDIIQNVIDSESDRYDRLTESAQDGPVGERIENAIECMESAVSDLESAADQLDDSML